MLTLLVSCWVDNVRSGCMFPTCMTKCHSIRHQTPKFPTPQKSYATICLGYSGPYFGPTNTNHTKNYQKITFGALFRIPPQNAQQCTTVQVQALELFTPDGSNMTHNDPGWLCMARDAITGVRGVPGGPGGHQGKPGATRLLPTPK